MKQRLLKIIRSIICLSGFFMTVGACSHSVDAPSSKHILLSVIPKALLAKDTGAIMEIVDHSYHDDRGGPGRLEDDLRRIFSVYGGLKFQVKNRSKDQSSPLKISYTLSGRGLVFDGPMSLSFNTTAQGPVITSGVFTDMRAILDILRQRRIALESGTVDVLDAIISMEYKPERGTRQQFISRFEESLSSQGRVGIVVKNVKISIDKNMAEVVQSILELQIDKAKARERRVSEHIVLRKEGARWRIFEGLG